MAENQSKHSVDDVWTQKSECVFFSFFLFLSPLIFNTSWSIECSVSNQCAIKSTALIFVTCTQSFSIEARKRRKDSLMHWCRSHVPCLFNFCLGFFSVTIGVCWRTETLVFISNLYNQFDVSWFCWNSLKALSTALLTWCNKRSKTHTWYLLRLVTGRSIIMSSVALVLQKWFAAIDQLRWKKYLSNPREALREWAKHFLIFLSFFLLFLDCYLLDVFFFILRKHTHSHQSWLGLSALSRTIFNSILNPNRPNTCGAKKTTLLCFVLLSTDNAKGNMRDVCSFFLSIFNAIERIDCRDWWIIFISLKIQIISPAC